MADNAVVQVPFSIGPGVATSTVIDFNTPTGIKLFNSATASLYPSKQEAFAVNAEKIHSFIQKVNQQAIYYGLSGGTGILNIPINSVFPLGQTRSLVTEYGLITIEQVQQHAMTYVTLPTRATQDSAMLFLCLMNSLTEPGQDKVRAWHELYTVAGHLSGPLLLKVIIQQSNVDTNATTRHIRTKLSNVDAQFAKLGYDVGKLNLYVRT
jgi:hypothetical protein